ncbi:DUF7542 family protein [Haloarchaeobius baliensis]|uniref:DUF7542 family protein n=1 Tax=Haloarchaeobius baliensis TaxID=1670458 RepID=UPI003F8846F5
MNEGNVEVECTDCEYRESFRNLRTARVALDEHESESGHSVDWDIERVDNGVERAGADAGVCGIPGMANPDSPLLDGRPSDEE